MAGDERWYFTKEQLLSPQTNPTQKCGIDADKELSYRQQAANFIQDMGQRLKVTQLCINTAIVYMHRFYMFHSFSKFHRNAISSCALFLAAKVEEQPRKLEHVINVAHKCLHRDVPALDTKSEAYLEQAHELVVNENIMLQTLASKDLAQTSYFMATNSLHLTTMCLQYRPTFVACVCIHLACKWSSWEIPKSSEGKEWFWYVDKSVTSELLEELTSEFLAILDKCPSKLKRKMSLAKELLPEEKKTKVGTSQPSSKEVIKQNHVNSQQSSKSHQLRLPSPKKQIKKSPGQPSVNGKENPDHSFHLQVTSVPTLSSSPSENISPSKKIKPEGSVTISLAAYREMKEKRDKERQSQQDDVRKQVGASGSEEKKVVNHKHTMPIKKDPKTSDHQKVSVKVTVQKTVKERKVRL
ncbi:cyclin-T2-like isoform X2 [Tachypleus tridentatus]|uniref:cyclin-T2-like isoform X2 n=1 Tax=Tachypleus tridentatus TaxID=6853 RepID=UPI003FD1BF8C